MMLNGGGEKKYIVNYFLYACIRCNFATGEKIPLVESVCRTHVHYFYLGRILFTKVMKIEIIQ